MAGGVARYHLRPTAATQAEAKERQEVINIVSISGGRTSGYLAHLVRKMDPSARFVFLDTGGEHPATYRFIREISERWGIEIECVRQVINPKLRGRNSWERVPIESLKFDMQYMKALVTKLGTFTAHQSHCTRDMKRRTYDNYIAATTPKGEPRTTWLGIRADEPKRLHPRDNVRYMAEISDYEKYDVIKWWSKQPFDLGIEEHLGNCVFCVKKNTKKIALAIRDEPGLAEQWRAMHIGEHVRTANLPSREPGQSHMIYRNHNTGRPASMDQVIAMFAEHSRTEIYESMRFSGGFDSGSCSEEECGMFNDLEDSTK